jgi:surface protein
MQSMFANAFFFNQPIGNWNTGRVVSMNSMFDSAVYFNQPIGNWNTSQVTDMNSMFDSAGSFNQPIGDWDTSQVTDMNSMFHSAGSFNQPIGDWDTSQVTDMRGMFQGASSFNQPIGDWDTSQVVTSYSFSEMFKDATAWLCSHTHNTSDPMHFQRYYDGPPSFWFESAAGIGAVCLSPPPPTTLPCVYVAAPPLTARSTGTARSSVALSLYTTVIIIYFHA